MAICVMLCRANKNERILFFFPAIQLHQWVSADLGRLPGRKHKGQGEVTVKMIETTQQWPLKMIWFSVDVLMKFNDLYPEKNLWR